MLKFTRNKHQKSNIPSVVIFGGYATLKSIILTNEAIRLKSQLNHFKIALICDTTREKDNTKVRALWGLQTLYMFDDIKVVTPKNNDINNTEFIKYLQNEIRPDYAFSFGCDQVFSSALLNVFRACINNHNGTLPKYSGWMATTWSLYNKEKKTGYCYHYMDQNIDTGNKLYSASISVGTKNLRLLKYNKAKMSAKKLKTVLEKVFQDDQGKPIQGKRNYYGKKAFKKITCLKDPSKYTLGELRHRLNSFGVLQLFVNHSLITTTDFKVFKDTSKKSRGFMTLDQHFIIPLRESKIKKITRFIKNLILIYKLRFRM